MANIKEIIRGLEVQVQLLREHDLKNKLLSEDDALEKAIAIVDEFYGSNDFVEEIIWVLERGFGRIDCGHCGSPMSEVRRKHLYCQSCIEDGCEDAKFGKNY